MAADTRPRTRTFLVLATAVALLVGLIAMWSNPFGPRSVAAEASGAPVPLPTVVATTPSSAPTKAPKPSWTFRTADGPEVTVEYEVPEGIDLAVGQHPGYLALSTERNSLDFESRPAGKAVGLRIVDATRARPHFNNGRPLGADAATFLEGLATNERVGRPELGPVVAAQLGRDPAWSVDLLGPVDTLVHLDAMGTQDGSAVSIDLAAPSRLIVADIGAAIILVDVWAGPKADFKAWLAQVQPLIRSLRIKVSDSTPGQAVASQLSTVKAPEGWRLVRSGKIDIGLAVGDVLMASNYDVGEVYRYDRASLRSLGTISGRRGEFPPDAQSLAPGRGGVWVTLAAQRAVGLIDPASGEIIRRIPVDGYPYDLVEHGRDLWIIDYENSNLIRMDRRSGQVGAQIVVQRPTDVVFAEGAVWATVHVGRSEQFQPIVGNGGRIARIDPATNQVVALLDVGPRPYFLAGGFGAVWTGTATGASVVRIDAATNQVTTIPVSRDGAFDIEVVGDSVWATVEDQYWAPPCDPETSFFVRIDPTTNTVRERIAFPCPAGLTVDGNRLWVSGRDSEGPVLALFEPRG